MTAVKILGTKKINFNSFEPYHVYLSSLKLSNAGTFFDELNENCIQVQKEKGKYY